MPSNNSVTSLLQARAAIEISCMNDVQEFFFTARRKLTYGGAQDQSVVVDNHDCWCSM